MARPTKTGLDYFPLDVDMDEKMDLLESKYGLAGFAVMVKLWQRIYKNEGYYYPWNEDHLLLFKKQLGTVEMEYLRSVIMDALHWGIFDEMMYRTYSILTSRGIQKRYFHISKRRKDKLICRKFILLELSDIHVPDSELTHDIPVEVDRVLERIREGNRSRFGLESIEKQRFQPTKTELMSTLTPNIHPNNQENRVYLSAQNGFNGHIHNEPVYDSDVCVMHGDDYNNDISFEQNLRKHTEINHKQPKSNKTVNVNINSVTVPKSGGNGQHLVHKEKRIYTSKRDISMVLENSAKKNAETALSFSEFSDFSPEDSGGEVITTSLIDSLLDVYPFGGKVGNLQNNRDEVGDAISRVKHEKGCTVAEAVAWLRDQVVVFAGSDVAKQERRFVPRSGTYFRDRMYEQDAESFVLDEQVVELMTWEEAYGKGFTKDQLEQVAEKDNHGRRKVRVKPSPSPSQGEGNISSGKGGAK